MFSNLPLPSLCFAFWGHRLRNAFEAILKFQHMINWHFPVHKFSAKMIILLSIFSHFRLKHMVPSIINFVYSKVVAFHLPPSTSYSSLAHI